MVRVVDEAFVRAAFFVLVAVLAFVVVLCLCLPRRICIEGVWCDRTVLRGRVYVCVDARARALGTVARAQAHLRRDGDDGAVWLHQTL